MVENFDDMFNRLGTILATLSGHAHPEIGLPSQR